LIDASLALDRKENRIAEYVSCPIMISSLAAPVLLLLFIVISTNVLALVFFLKLAKIGTVNDSIWRKGMGGDLICVEQEKYFSNGLLFDFGD